MQKKKTSKKNKSLILTENNPRSLKEKNKLFIGGWLLENLFINKKKIYKEDIFVSGIDFKSDNPEVIHHLMLYLDVNNILEDDGSWDCKNDGLVKKSMTVVATTFAPAVPPLCAIGVAIVIAFDQ